MLNFKKLFFLIICGILFISCSKQHKNIHSESSTNINSNNKLKVIATIFPAYDWTKNIASNNIDLELLINNGTDFHSFEPTVADIVKISNCDLLIYIGGESDKWINSILQNSTNKNLQTINLIDLLKNHPENKIKYEEHIEGMQEEHNHSHEHEHEHEHEEDHAHEDSDIEYDEHVWLSLKNAKFLTTEIASKIIQLDQKNKNLYLTKLESYITQLDNLDNEYSKKIAQAKTKTILVADRFPFRYLVDDYELNYFAAFVGCSAETEASFKTITFLSNKLDELKLNSVLKIENSDDKLAKTIIENSHSKNQKILTLNSMQSITTNDINNGISYQKIMQNNLRNLIEALK